VLPLAVLALVVQAAPAATPGRVAECAALATSAEKPVTVRGRLYAANGGGSGFRLWIVGTTRIVWLTAKIDPAVPDAVHQAFTPFSEELYGTFTLVPLRPDTPGVMREVCLVSGQHLTRRKARH
jgi:hypothetical protein